GVARELAPKGAADLQSAEFPGSPGATLETLVGETEAANDRVRVTIEATRECPRYLAAVNEGVEVGPSPEWVAARLRSIELRPINNVVDATNYVLHELSQPLHAFDLDKLVGPEIRVRLSRPGETLRTLDGIDRSLAE